MAEQKVVVPGSDEGFDRQFSLVQRVSLFGGQRVLKILLM
jgi:hypothetical protein